MKNYLVFLVLFIINSILFYLQYIFIKNTSNIFKRVIQTAIIVFINSFLIVILGAISNFSATNFIIYSGVLLTLYTLHLLLSTDNEQRFAKDVNFLIIILGNILFNVFFFILY